MLETVTKKEGAMPSSEFSFSDKTPRVYYEVKDNRIFIAVNKSDDEGTRLEVFAEYFVLEIPAVDTSVSPQVVNQVYSAKDMIEMKENTILDVRDVDGNWFPAKIIRPYDEKLGTVRIHFSGWGTRYNESVPVGEKRFAVLNTFTTKKYVKSLFEYDVYNPEDRAYMQKKGLLLNEAEINALNVGDVIEVCYDVWKCGKVIDKSPDGVKCIDHDGILIGESLIQYYWCAKIGTYTFPVKN
jgi:hypothetical protein